MIILSYTALTLAQLTLSRSMPTDYKAIITQYILDKTTFLQATFTGSKNRESASYVKAIARPLIIKGKHHLQFEFHSTNKVIHENYADDDIAQKLEELLNIGFRNIYIKTNQKDLQIQITKKGKALISEHQSTGKQAIDLTHDRVKQKLISATEHPDYLKAIGLMTQDNVIKAGMQGKFKQVNEFLKNIDRTSDLQSLAQPIHVVDCGCGNAYLTFSTYYYLNQVLGLPTHLTGIDINVECTSKHAATADRLGWNDIKFEISNIIDFQPAIKPQIVLALHACDTATDDALVRAIEWQSQLIFSVPCCHKNLQQQLDRHAYPLTFEPLCQYGILRERQADLLTDTFRSLLLNIMGYKVSVIEFISSEHTAKNIMIRATKSSGSPDREIAIEKYRNLKQYWQVTPSLEELLINRSLLDPAFTSH